jgi:hypothetical protein
MDAVVRSLPERTRNAGLVMLVMLLPATTLYSQIVGVGTTIFGTLYVVLTLVLLQLGRSAPIARQRTKLWEARAIPRETPLSR